MKKNETKLLASRAVNKIGNVMYDYGNSTWIAGLGSIGQNTWDTINQPKT